MTMPEESFEPSPLEQDPRFATYDDFVNFAPEAGTTPSVAARVWHALTRTWIRQNVDPSKLPPYERDSWEGEFPIVFEGSVPGLNNDSVSERARLLHEGLDLESLETYLNGIAEAARERNFSTLQRQGRLPEGLGQRAVLFLHHFLQSRGRPNGDFSQYED